MFADLPLPDPALPLLIAGPTASGKSALALRIAQVQGRVIVNADALQVHDSFRLLTARPTEIDEAAAPHLLYGHVARGQDYSVGHWLREVAGVLRDHPAPVIVGGTGLYLSALTEGLAEIPPTPPAIRAEADRLIARDGPGALLATLDPETAGRIDPRNPARVQRAWEVLRATGRGLASWQAQTDPPLIRPEAATLWALTPRTEWLAPRIETRFARMVVEGALDEVAAILPYWPQDLRPGTGPLWTRAIGAPELVAHLQGQMSLDEACAAATLATRQYAKRQRTWIRNRLRGWRALALP